MVGNKAALNFGFTMEGLGERSKAWLLTGIGEGAVAKPSTKDAIFCRKDWIRSAELDTGYNCTRNQTLISVVASVSEHFGDILV